jgi:sortase A
MSSLKTADHASPLLLRALEYALIFTATICLSWYGWQMYQVDRGQSRAVAEIQEALRTPATAANESGRDIAPFPVPPIGGIIGRLEIPRLHLTAPVKAGENNEVLDFSVGYLPDTPLPWMPGNSAFAAHRDRLFRPLENIREGDDITLSTTHGNLRYRVLQTLIVNPSDVWVLDPIPKVSLTLITCYPFYYVGHAPRRFIVQAEKL